MQRERERVRLQKVRETDSKIECVFVCVFVRERKRDGETSPQNLFEKRSNLFRVVKPALLIFEDKHF